MEPALNKQLKKKIYKGGAEKSREKKELQLKIAAKSCQKISDIFASNQLKTTKVILIYINIYLYSFIS